MARLHDAEECGLGMEQMPQPGSPEDGRSVRRGHGGVRLYVLVGALLAMGVWGVTQREAAVGGAIVIYLSTFRFMLGLSQLKGVASSGSPHSWVIFVHEALTPRTWRAPETDSIQPSSRAVSPEGAKTPSSGTRQPLAGCANLLWATAWGSVGRMVIAGSSVRWRTAFQGEFAVLIVGSLALNAIAWRTGEAKRARG